MLDFFKKRPFSKAGLLGIPMLFIMLLLESYFPKNAPEGFQSFIVAFEFAKTPGQIQLLLNDLPTDAIRKIDIGNYIDFIFMFCYSLFLFLFFRKASRMFAKKWLKTGMLLSVIVLLADFAENLLLLRITSIYSPVMNDALLVSTLTLLHISTWIKWAGLTIIFAIFSLNFLGKNFASNIYGIILIFPLLLIFWAITNDAMGISNFTLSVILAFLLLIFYSFRYKTTSDDLVDQQEVVEMDSKKDH